MGGCKYRPVDVQLDLAISKKQYMIAIKRLTGSGAVIITPQGRYTIVTIAGEKVDVDGAKEKRVKEEKQEKVEEKIIELCASNSADLSDIVLF